MPVSPKQINALRKGHYHGKRGPEGQQKKRRTQIMLTPDSKAKLRTAQCPFRRAGYKSLSQFVEMAMQGQVQVPPKDRITK